MSLALEDFTLASISDAARKQGGLTPKQSEAEQAEIYAQGYQAGWDDALKSKTDEQDRIDAELARHVQEMSFTFHEARAHLVQAIEPLLEQILTTFLPAIIQESMGQRVVEALEPLVNEAVNAPVLIQVARGQKDVVMAQMSSSALTAIEVIEEETLTVGQAFLKLGKIERKIDLSEAVDHVITSLHALTELNRKVLKND